MTTQELSIMQVVNPEGVSVGVARKVRLSQKINLFMLTTQQPVEVVEHLDSYRWHAETINFQHVFNRNAPGVYHGVNGEKLTEINGVLTLVLEDTVLLANMTPNRDNTK